MQLLCLTQLTRVVAWRQVTSGISQRLLLSRSQEDVIGADPGDQEVEPGASLIAAAGLSERKLLSVLPACTSPA